jgi:uncharacterized protein YihD (DUF1040 family)
MRTKVLLIGWVILALALSGCAAKSSPNDVYTADRSSTYQMGVPEVAPEAPMAEEYYGVDGEKGFGVPAAENEVTQMVMMNASLDIAVDDPSVTLNDVQKLAREMGGFTVYSNLYKTQILNGSEVFEASVTIRVPAERLDEAMTKIKAMTGDPKKYTLNENISGQDVTKEYTDLQSRLRNLEEADAKLSEFYENATNTEEALSIYTQKMQVTEQIELIKGQMKYYEDSVYTSAVTVSIRSKQSIAPLTVAGWKPSGVAKDALEALLKFGKGLVNFIIWLGLYILPIVLVLGLPVFFLVRWLIRRNHARKQAAVAKWIKDHEGESVPPIPEE